MTSLEVEIVATIATTTIKGLSLQLIEYFQASKTSSKNTTNLFP
jgi:hypothetical protein